ncbi:MAG: MaoC family dehydratase, partial [Candidatus Binataceae bacterium]
MADYPSDLIGKEFAASAPVQVTAEMIAEFCAAIGETNPIYLDAEAARQGPFGVIVAPLSVSGSFRAAEDIFDHLPPAERRLLASMELAFVAPIRAGDTITISSAVAEIYEKTGRSGVMVFTVIRSILRNQDGEIVTRLDHRFTSRK